MSKPYQRGTDLLSCPTCDYHEQTMDASREGIWESWTFICNALAHDTCPREQAEKDRARDAEERRQRICGSCYESQSAFRCSDCHVPKGTLRPTAVCQTCDNRKTAPMYHDGWMSCAHGITRKDCTVLDNCHLWKERTND